MKKSVEIELEKLYIKRCPNGTRYLYWGNLSWTEVLSEEIIREFKDKVDWKSISVYQKLSRDFIIKFKDKLDLESMLQNEIIAQEFYNELKEIKMLNRYQILDFS